MTEPFLYGMDVWDMKDLKNERNTTGSAQSVWRCVVFGWHCTAVDRPTAAAQHQTGVAAVLLWQSDGGLRRAHISPA